MSTDWLKSSNDDFQLRSSFWANSPSKNTQSSSTATATTAMSIRRKPHDDVDVIDDDDNEIDLDDLDDDNNNNDNDRYNNTRRSNSNLSNSNDGGAIYTEYGTPRHPTSKTSTTSAAAEATTEAAATGRQYSSSSSEWRSSSTLSVLFLFLAWYMCSMLSNTYSKTILEHISLPLTLTITQFFFISLFCMLLIHGFGFKADPVTFALIRKAFPVALGNVVA